MWRHVTEDPVRALLLGWRVLPGRVRPWLRWAGPYGRATVAWGSGDRKQALTLLHTTPRRLATFALAVDRPAAARRALDRMPTDDPARVLLLARLAGREGRLRAGVAALDGVPGRKQAKVLGTLSGELYVLEEGIPRSERLPPAARVAPARAGPGPAPGHRRAADHQRRLHRPHPADRAGPAAGRPGSARGDQGRFPGRPGPPRWPPGRPGQRRAVPPAAAVPAATAGRRRGQPGPRPGRPAGRAAPPGRAARGQQPPERPARAGPAGGLRPAGNLRSPRFLGGDLAVAARGRSRRSGRAGRGPPSPVATS